MDNNNIGDFAANLLAQERVSEAVPMPMPVAGDNDIPEYYANTPDISTVVVPDSFITGVITEEKKPELKEEPVVMVQKVQDTSDLLTLIDEVKILLSEVKQVLTEVSTVGGGLGAPAAKSKKPPKDDETMEDTLAQILRRRVRKS